MPGIGQQVDAQGPIIRRSTDKTPAEPRGLPVSAWASNCELEFCKYLGHSLSMIMELYPRANVLVVGTTSFPRYVIVEDGNAAPQDRKYWAGEKWIDIPRLAALFAHQQLAWDEVRRLRAGQAHR